MVIQVARLADGKRKVVSIEEVTGMEGDTISMQEIFAFDQTGTAVNGAVQGNFCATGIKPSFCDRLRLAGVELGHRVFDAPE